MLKNCQQAKKKVEVTFGLRKDHDLSVRYLIKVENFFAIHKKNFKLDLKNTNLP
jgi:hypothetical protein